MQPMAATAPFPFVDPPPTWIDSAAVKRQPGTRWWVESGPIQHMYHWLRDLNTHLPGNLLPLQWVPAYVGVTRPAVKTRVDGGMLTLFTFQVVHDASPRRGGKRGPLRVFPKTMLGESRQKFDYAVLSECDAWADLIAERLCEDD